MIYLFFLFNLEILKSYIHDFKHLAQQYLIVLIYDDLPKYLKDLNKYFFFSKGLRPFGVKVPA